MKGVAAACVALLVAGAGVSGYLSWLVAHPLYSPCLSALAVACVGTAVAVGAELVARRP